MLVENPVAAGPEVNENDTFGYLAAHLGARGIPVPGVLAYKRSRGWSLVEDLGDRDLFSDQLDLLFIDTTSLYVYRDTETAWRKWGYSRDRRGDLPRFVICVAVDRRG